MGRPVMPIGGHGNISSRKLPSGQWQARANFRDSDGITRPVAANGSSKPKAINALTAKMKARSVRAGEDIGPETLISELAEIWFSSLRQSPGTQDIYRGVLDTHILPRLGANRIREVTTGRVERFISDVSEPIYVDIIAKNGRPMRVKKGGPTAATLARTVLGLMFRLAVRRDALTANPVRESLRPVAIREEIRALTLDEFRQLRQNILAWQDSGVMGPRKSKDLVDKVDLFVATGLRPGELFGLLWKDVNFDASPPTVEVTGTVKRTTKDGLHRQTYPKSEHGKRILGLPPFAVKMLARRQLAEEPGSNPLGLIFPSRTGGLIDPGNFHRQWSEARGKEFEWVKPSSFRKAVATLIERDAGSIVASKQLGHSSDAVTRRHYIERNRETPNTTSILEQFGQASGDI